MRRNQLTLPLLRLLIVLCIFTDLANWASAAEIPAIASAADSDASPTSPVSAYWDRREEGWFWYQDPPPEPVAKKRKPDVAHAHKADDADALHAFKARLARLRDIAVMNPTDANVRAYLYAQQHAMDQSAKFADVWRRVVWSTPDLDYSMRGRPTNSVAMQTWDSGLMAKKEAHAASLANKYGLFFFFRGGCPYCHAQAPVLASFAQQYGFHVIPISLDGAKLPEFPDAVRNAGQAEQLRVETVPALFLVRPETREIQPIGYGVLAASDILDRIWVLTATSPGDTIQKEESHE
jgi:conjugal transfer pilus assembly protein TraF